MASCGLDRCIYALRTRRPVGPGVEDLGGSVAVSVGPAEHDVWDPVIGGCAGRSGAPMPNGRDDFIEPARRCQTRISRQAAALVATRDQHQRSGLLLPGSD